MASYKCYNCGDSFSIIDSSFYYIKGAFGTFENKHYGGNNIHQSYPETVVLEFYKCPACGYVHIEVEGVGNDVRDLRMKIRPNSYAKSFPGISANVKKIYEESCAVITFSPRASAALSRVCLETILLDKFGIKGKLSKQIEEFDIKCSKHEIYINPDFITALHGIREMGNGGLHPEINIDVLPEEAQQILEVVEMFLQEVYVNEKIRKEKLEKVESMKEKVSFARKQ